MQLIALLNGSKLIRVKNHVNKSIIIYTGKTRSKVKCYHKYTLKNCPKGFNVVSISRDENIECIKSKKHKILCIMWHPEREKKFNLYNINIFQNFFKK